MTRVRIWVYAAAFATKVTAALWATLAIAAPGYQPDVRPQAATLTVTNASDAVDANPGDGVCDDGAGNCTLRAAIMEANASADTDTIAFDIPGAGPHTIRPASALPAITDPVVIDGYTQTGASPNTNLITTGSNAVLMIELDGSNAGASSVHGLLITTGGSMVRGLVINRFSGNGVAIFGGEAAGNLVEGSFIGTDLTGSADLGNSADGVQVLDAPENTIGGTTAGARNVISGNGVAGVSISGVVSTGNLVEGNFLGTDVSGTAPLGNSRFGVIVHLGASGNTVGGTALGARNVVADNRDYGVEVSNGARDKLVLGNFIGTDVTGTKRLGNGAGICVQNTTGNVIGGTAAGAGNLISGNVIDGVLIDHGSMANLVLGNYIGTQVNGADKLGNGRHGVHIEGASNNTVGGASVEARNVIAHNGGSGVLVSAATGDAILGNSIFTNGVLGIDLVPNGVSLNDPGDADTGPNGLQNFPMLTSASGGATTITVAGSLNSTANSPFRLEFFFNGACDPSGYGEGERFLGFTVVTADASGNTTFAVTLSTPARVGGFITATATDPDNNTSEFSKCVRVVQVFEMPGDVSGDGQVDTEDLRIVTANLGRTVPPANPRADLNWDGLVDIFDLALVAINLGRAAP